MNLSIIILKITFDLLDFQDQLKAKFSIRNLPSMTIIPSLTLRLALVFRPLETTKTSSLYSGENKSSRST